MSIHCGASATNAIIGFAEKNTYPISHWASRIPFGTNPRVTYFN